MLASALEHVAGRWKCKVGVNARPESSVDCPSALPLRWVGLVKRGKIRR